MHGKRQPKSRCLTPGQAADRVAAETSLAEIDTGMTSVADGACDTHAILDPFAVVGPTAVIPSRSNRTEPRMLDPALYATRNPVARIFRGMKEFCGVGA